MSREEAEVESSDADARKVPAALSPEQEPASEVPAQGEIADEDFYMDGDFFVFTAAYHLKRGYCCKSDCRHCPYRET